MCRVTVLSAASTAAFAIKLLTLLRSAAAAWSTSVRSSSVRYTKVFRPNGCSDRRRDLGAAPFFMAAMVHRRNGEPNVAFGSALAQLQFRIRASWDLRFAVISGARGSLPAILWISESRPYAPQRSGCRNDFEQRFQVFPLFPGLQLSGRGERKEGEKVKP